MLASVLVAASMLPGCNRPDSEADLVARLARRQDIASAKKEAQERLAVNETESVGEQIMRVEQAIDRDEMALAAKQLHQILVRWPNDSKALFLSAQLHAQNQELPTAIEVLNEIPLDDEEWGLAAGGQRAEWLSQTGHFEKSKVLYQTLIEMAPEVALLRHRYAALLNAIGYRHEAAKILRPLLKSDGLSVPELRSLLRVSASFHATQSPIDSAHEAQHPLNQALGFLWNRQPRQASAVIKDLVAQGTRDPFTLSLLASANAELQQFDVIESLLNSSTKDLESMPHYWLAIGDRENHFGKDEKAIAAYAQAYTLDPTNRLVLDRLMASLLKLGKIQGARSVDDRLMILQDVWSASFAVSPGAPDDYRAGKNLVNQLENLGEFDQAKAWLKHLASRHKGTELAKKYTAFNDRPAPSNNRTSLLETLGLKFLDVEHTTWTDVGPAKPIAAESLDTTQVTPACFVDVAEELGAAHVYLNSRTPKLRNMLIFQSYAAGIVAQDFDRDGSVDLYVGQGASDPPTDRGLVGNALYRQFDGEFVEVGSEACAADRGYAQGMTGGDINQDGFADLVIGNLGRNVLFINQGDGTFRQADVGATWSRHDFTTAVAIADVSGDGLPEVVEINYLDDPDIFRPLEVAADGYATSLPLPLTFRAAKDRVWVSGLDGVFSEMVLGRNDGPVSKLPELGDEINPGLGLIVTDLDGAAGLEIFVANDGRPNQLWRVRDVDGTDINAESIVSPHGLTATESAVASGCAFSSRGEPNACMGVAQADFDQNGLPDLLITNWINEWVNLFVQSPRGLFKDLAPRFELDQHSEGLLGFGAQAIDYDNNSWNDVVIGNGHIDQLRGKPFKMPTQLLVNRNGRFVEAEQTIPEYWDDPHLSRCVVTNDFNRDGRTDFAVVDFAEPMALLENRTVSSNHWIQLNLVGVFSERDAIGARVEVLVNESTVLCEVVATGNGYQGYNEPLLHFGLGNHEGPVDVRVTWPHGIESYWPALVTDTRYQLFETNMDPFLVH